MHRKSWLIPITVCIVCSMLLLSYQRTAAATTHSYLTSHAEPLTFTNENMATHIMGIYLKNKDTMIEASRTGHNWTVSTPVAFDANSSYIHNNLTKLFTQSHLEVIQFNPTNISNYGIGHYNISLTLTLDSGNTFTLIKGHPIDETLSYAYDEINDVLYQIDDDAFYYFSLYIEDWYKKEYIEFDHTTTSQITLDYNGEIHNIYNVSDDTPEIPFSSHTLNEVQVGTILDFLSSSRIEKLITFNASETAISNYGFNHETIVLTLFSEDIEVQSLVISTSFFSDHYTYVFLPDDQTIVAIPSFSFIDISNK